MQRIESSQIWNNQNITELEGELKGLTFVTVEVDTLRDLDEIIEDQTFQPEELAPDASPEKIRELTCRHVLEEFLAKLSVIGFTFAGVIRLETEDYPGLILMQRSVKETFATESDSVS